MDTALKFILPVILVAGVSHAEEPRTLEEYARRREIHNHRVEQEEIRMGEQAVRARDAELRASHGLDEEGLESFFEDTRSWAKKFANDRFKDLIKRIYYPYHPHASAEVNRRHELYYATMVSTQNREPLEAIEKEDAARVKKINDLAAAIRKGGSEAGNALAEVIREYEKKYTDRKGLPDFTYLRQQLLKVSEVDPEVLRLYRASIKAEGGLKQEFHLNTPPLPLPGEPTLWQTFETRYGQKNSAIY